MDSTFLSCTVPGCTETYQQNTKRRIRVCPTHRAAETVAGDGGKPLRFCQQCSRLHPLDRFEGDQRACSRRLMARQRSRGSKTPSSDSTTTDVEIPVMHELPTPVHVLKHKPTTSPTSALHHDEQQETDIPLYDLHPQTPSWSGASTASAAILSPATRKRPAVEACLLDTGAQINSSRPKKSRPTRMPINTVPAYDISDVYCEAQFEAHMMDTWLAPLEGPETCLPITDREFSSTCHTIFSGFPAEITNLLCGQLV